MIIAFPLQTWKNTGKIIRVHNTILEISLILSQILLDWGRKLWGESNLLYCRER